MDFALFEGYCKCLFSVWQKHAKGRNVVGYVDSNFASDQEKRRSLSGYIFTFYNSAIGWKASLHSIVALSTT